MGAPPLTDRLLTTPLGVDDVGVEERAEFGVLLRDGDGVDDRSVDTLRLPTVLAGGFLVVVVDISESE